MRGACVVSGVGETVVAVVVGATVVGVAESVVGEIISSAAGVTFDSSGITVVTFSLNSSSGSNVVISTEVTVVVLVSCFCCVLISSDCACVVISFSTCISVVVSIIGCVVVVVDTGSGSNGGAGAHETPAASSRLIKIVFIIVFSFFSLAKRFPQSARRVSGSPALSRPCLLLPC